MNWPEVRCARIQHKSRIFYSTLLKDKVLAIQFPYYDNDLFDFEAVRPIVDLFGIPERAIQIIDDQLLFRINTAVHSQIRMSNCVLLCHNDVLSIELIPFPVSCDQL